MDTVRYGYNRCFPELERKVLLLGGNHKLSLTSSYLQTAAADPASSEYIAMTDEAFVEASLKFAPTTTKKMRHKQQVKLVNHLKADFAIQVELCVGLALHYWLQKKGISWRLVKHVEPAAAADEEYEVKLLSHTGCSTQVRGM